MNAEAARGQPVDGAETLYRFVTATGPGVCGCLSTGVFRVMLLLRSHPSDGLPGLLVLLLQHFIQDVGVQNSSLHTLTRQYGRDRPA